MRLIVTRPNEDAGNLISALERQGHAALAAPMISIEPISDAKVPDDTWQAILVTSANSVRALVLQPGSIGLLSTPVLAVGPASARAATQAGFTSVTSADGDLKALMGLARRQLSASQGSLLYPSGLVTSGDLKSQLEEEGFSCVRVPLYDAVPAQSLPAELVTAIQDQQFDGVLLFSPRTAQIWASCVQKAGGYAIATTLTHWCLSTAVADALCREVPDWPIDQSTVIAPHPNEESLLEAIGTI